MPKKFSPKLSPRTEGIVALVPECGTVADIGCDHGYVSIALVQRNIAKKAIACDIKEGPLEHAKVNITKAEMSDKIDVRLFPGLKGLEKGEADVIVIAGMGQRTISDILNEEMEKAKAAEYLVLQPQSEIPEMRRFLKENGFNILKNSLMTEGEKFYFAMLVSAKNSDESEDGIAKRLREDENPELKGFTRELDELFGLDLIFNDKDLAYYLMHVINEWGEAIEKLNGAKKPDFERIASLAAKKARAEIALEYNTLFCGIDKKMKNFIEAQLNKKSETG